MPGITNGDLAGENYKISVKGLLAPAGPIRPDLYFFTENKGLSNFPVKSKYI
jgi:hypothetical protein